MTHVIFVTQVVDPQDPVLGNVPSLVRALAARTGSVTVIANEVRDASAVEDVARVVSLGKERGAGRLARGAALERAVAEATSRRPAILLAHMCPSYLVLAAPIARARGVPATLWFAHPSVTSFLRVADRLASAVMTSLPDAYPLASPKVHAIGQAIDVSRFDFDPRPPGDPLRLLSLGRTSPSKGHDRAIRAVARARAAGVDASLRVVGPSTTSEEVQHRRDLQTLVIRESLEGVVSIEPSVPPADVVALLQGSDALVSAMVGGAGDKVVFEAMAIGRMALVSNPAFAPLLNDLPFDLTFDRDDEEALATRIGALDSIDPNDAETVLRTLRSRIERDHSLDHWASSVLSCIEALR